MQLIILVSFLIAVSVAIPSTPIGHQDFNDGPCEEPKPMNLEKLDIEWALRFTLQAGYVPLGSKVHFYTFGAILLGRPVTEEDDFSDMCPTVESGLFENTAYGFGKKVTMACDIIGIGYVQCFQPGNESKTNTTMAITWSDNTNYMVSVSCLPGNYRAWNIISTEKTVKPESYEKIIQHIEELGFKKENSMTVGFEKCN